MNFYQAHTYWESLQQLKSTQGAQKAVIDCVSLLLEDDKHPSLQLHPLNNAKDPNMWSVRAGLGFRIILHRTNVDTVLLYAGLHDPAYKWGENRVLKTHPKTGSMQIVVLREEEEIVKVPFFVPEEVNKPPPLAHIQDDDLLGYGVPEENLVELKAANEDRLLEIAVDLPLEAQEAVLVIAGGGKPESHKAKEGVVDPFQHPDAKSRFRVLENVEELEQALEYDWEKWVVFLHPAQRGVVEQSFNGPARASGTAGTGKTVVALHRTAHLARKDESARILLTTFSDTLAALLRDKLRQLVTTEPRLMEQIEVISLDRLAEHLYPKLLEPAELAPDSLIEQLLADTASELGEEQFTKQFIAAEWKQVVDAWQVNSWEEYRTIPRIGRKTRLPESRRADLWNIFQIVKDRLSSQAFTTQAAMYQGLATTISSSGRFPYDYAVVDEGQDVSVTQLRFLAALGGGRPDSLFFAGDLGQRIFQQPFSWLALGVDIRGRSRTLKVNYRTSHQIRTIADLLLDPEITDADGNREDRRGAVSVFNGKPPVVKRADSQAEEIEAVGDWLKSHIKGGVEKHEIGVFVRSHKELDRARVAASNAGLEYLVLDEAVHPAEGKVCLGTMHTAKGLEFRAVAVMGCDYNVIPSPERIEDVADESDLVEVMNTERHLLYVACTRARDFLLVTGVDPASEFLDDLEMG